jgi:hypothetical protein
MKADASKAVRNLTLLLIAANLLVVLVVIFKRPASEKSGAAANPTAGQGTPAPNSNAGGGAAPVADVQEAADAFDAWVQRFLAAAPEARSAMMAEGEALAGRRRAALKTLIQSDPRRALALAVPAAVRGRLPERIAAQLEEPIRGRGDLNVMIVDYFDQQRSETRREVVIGGLTFRAFVYGRRLDQTTGRDVPLQGIALDGLMAVHEDPP